MITAFRQALRALVREPRFSLAVIGTLVLGLAPVIAVFAFVHAILIRPLPYPDADRLVFVVQVDRTDAFGPPVTAVHDVLHRMSTLDLVTHVGNNSGTLLGAGEPTTVFASNVAPAFFSALSVRPIVGRVPGSEDRNSALISARLWRERLGSRADIAGTAIRFDQMPLVITGVLPETFRMPWAVDVWYTHQAPANAEIDTIARLRPGMTLEAARAELAGVSRSPEIAAMLNGGHLDLDTFRNGTVGFLDRPLSTLLSAAFVALLAACVNAGALVLAHGTARQRDVAVMLALGGGAGGVVRAAVAEAVCLGAVGAALSTLVAQLILDLVLAVTPEYIASITDIHLSPAVVTFAFAVSLGSAALSALVPAVRLTRANVRDVLANATPAASRRTGLTMQGLLAVQVALALVLGVASTTLIRSYSTLGARLDLIRTEGLASFDVVVPRRAKDLRVRLARAVADTLASRPAGTWALASAVPMTPAGAGATLTTAAGPVPATLKMVGEGYFRLLGIPVQRGREFTARDDVSAPMVGLVNEAAARRLQQVLGRDPIGASVRVRAEGDAALTIVGVVADVPMHVIAPARPEVYLSVRQAAPLPYLTVLLALADAKALRDHVARATHAIDGTVPVTEPRALRPYLEQQLGNPRFRAVLMSLFGAVATTVAASGVFAVVAFLGAQRRREIAIRLALGASQRRVALLAARAALLPVLAGVCAGVAGAVGARTVIQSLLIRGRADDPLMLGVASIAVVSIAVVLSACAAAAVLAVRTIRTDPGTVLRQE